MELMASYMDVGAFGQPMAGARGGALSNTFETTTSTGVCTVNEKTDDDKSLEKELFSKNEHCEVTLELAGSDETCL